VVDLVREVDAEFLADSSVWGREKSLSKSGGGEKKKVRRGHQGPEGIWLLGAWIDKGRKKEEVSRVKEGIPTLKRSGQD